MKKQLLTAIFAWASFAGISAQDATATIHLGQGQQKINKEISDSAISVMQTFSWKGNVRQLEKCIRNAALLYCDGDVIEPKDIKL